MLFPIIPDTSQKTLNIFNLGNNDIDFSSIEKHDFLKTGNKINKIGILFQKIEKEND